MPTVHTSSLWFDSVNTVLERLTANTGTALAPRKDPQLQIVVEALTPLLANFDTTQLEAFWLNNENSPWMLEGMQEQATSVCSPASLVLAYFLIKQHRRVQLCRYWPFVNSELQAVFSHLGVAPPQNLHCR